MTSNPCPAFWERRSVPALRRHGLERRRPARSYPQGFPAGRKAFHRGPDALLFLRVRFLQRGLARGDSTPTHAPPRPAQEDAHGLKDRLTELGQAASFQTAAQSILPPPPVGRPGMAERTKVVPGITVVELAGELEKNKTNLVTIIDPVQPGRRRGTSACLLRGQGPGYTTAPARHPSSQVFRWADSASWGLIRQPATSRTSGIHGGRGWGGTCLTMSRRRRGPLNRALLGALNRSNLASLSYAKWAEAAGAGLNGAKPVVVGEDRDERVFSNTVVIDDIAGQLERGSASFEALAAQAGGIHKTGLTWPRGPLPRPGDRPGGGRRLRCGHRGF